MSKGLDLPNESKQALREYLKYYVKCDDDFIHTEDIPKAFASLGYLIDEEDIEPLRELFDTNHDKKLQVDEIMDNLDVINIQPSHNKLTRHKIMAAFQMFDRGDDGFIRQDEFFQVMTAKLPQDSFKFDKKDCEDLWKLMQDKQDEDGKLNYVEFVKLFCGEEDSVS